MKVLMELDELGQKDVAPLDLMVTFFLLILIFIEVSRSKGTVRTATAFYCCGQSPNIEGTMASEEGDHGHCLQSNFKYKFPIFKNLNFQFEPCKMH